MNGFFQFVLGLALLSFGKVWACSVTINYVRPTNFELVFEAEAIVLAEATAFQKEKEYKGIEVGTFTFKVLDRYKGEFREQSFKEEGDTRKLGWGDPNDFQFSKGDTGLCNAENYAVGRKYVLFLRKFRDRWYISGPPFTRINVEVSGGDAPWSQAVQRYCEVAREGSYDLQKAGLKRLRERAANNEPGCPAGFVKDIDAHFQKPTEYKSGEDIMSLFNAATDDKDRNLALWAFANKEEPMGKPIVLDLIEEWEVA
jgi:hypothetical protein